MSAHLSIMERILILLTIIGFCKIDVVTVVASSLMFSKAIIWYTADSYIYTEYLQQTDTTYCYIRLPAHLRKNKKRFTPGLAI